MTNRQHRALLASLSAVALLLAATEGSARPAGAGPRGGVAAAHGHIGGPGARFHHRNSWVMWPGGGGFYYGPSPSESYAEFAPPLSNDINYTYTYDVPWDHTHRYPPNVVPSDRPYVPSCPSETVIVPGRGGAEHAVNIMRCY